MKKFFQGKEKSQMAEAEVLHEHPENEFNIVFSASLTVGQILKQMVLLNLKPTGGTTSLHAQRLSFGRSLLPEDYDFGEKREYSLVVKRVK